MIGGGTHIHIFMLCIISLEIECFHGQWTRIYEYVPPPKLSSLLLNITCVDLCVVPICTTMTTNWNSSLSVYPQGLFICFPLMSCVALRRTLTDKLSSNIFHEIKENILVIINKFKFRCRGSKDDQWYRYVRFFYTKITFFSKNPMSYFIVDTTTTRSLCYMTYPCIFRL